MQVSIIEVNASPATRPTATSNPLNIWVGTWVPVSSGDMSSGASMIEQPRGEITIALDSSGALRFSGGFSLRTANARDAGGGRSTQSFDAKISSGRLQKSSTRSDWYAVPGIFSYVKSTGSAKSGIANVDLSKPDTLQIQFPAPPDDTVDWINLSRK